MAKRQWSDEELAMLGAIHDNPHDDTLRLAYASWLTAQGDRRGKFIRLQCQERPWLPATSTSGFGRQRPRRWNAYHHEDLWPEPSWSKPLPGPLELAGYSRGLPLAYLPPMRQVSAKDPPLVPIERLIFRDWDRLLRRMSPAIRLSAHIASDEDLEWKMRHPLMDRVEILSIAGPLIPARAVELVGRSPFLRKLAHVHMNRLNADGEVVFNELIRPIVPNSFFGQGHNVGGAVYSEGAARAFMAQRGIEWPTPAPKQTE
jgi:uncharacterized protein (TIGR02996 family)